MNQNLAYRKRLPQKCRIFTKLVSNVSKIGLKQNNSFKWYFLASSQVNWADIENCVEFLSKEMPDIKIDDNSLFEDIIKLNLYFNSDKLEEWENHQVEIDKKWFIDEIFNHFKN